MAKLDPLPKGMAKTLVGQMAGLSALASPAVLVPAPPKGKTAVAMGKPKKAAASKLKESFAICMATVDQVFNPPADPATVFQSTGRWHHLIRSGGKLTQYAQSSEAKGFDGGGTTALTQMGAAHNGADVEAAIDCVEKEFQGDHQIVRWLEIPAYSVTALIVLAEKQAHAVLVSQPPAFTHLKKNAAYTLKEFFKQLAKETHT